MSKKLDLQLTQFVNIKAQITYTDGVFERFGIADRDTIVYKGLFYHASRWRNCIRCTAKLLIKKGTRVYLTNTKCRAECATVLEITKVKSNIRFTTADSTYLRLFQYHVGKKVIPDKFSLAYERCASGIHFFRTLREAREYLF
jgi:hypothetical protein